MTDHDLEIVRLSREDGAELRLEPVSWQRRSAAANAGLRAICRALMYGEEAALAAGDLKLADERRAQFLARIGRTAYVRPDARETAANLRAFRSHEIRLRTQEARRVVREHDADGQFAG